MATKWSDDAFLDRLRGHVDVAADDCVRALHELDGKATYRDVLAQMERNDATVPDDAPAPLREFFEHALGRPAIDGSPADQERIDRGGQVFLTRSAVTSLVLLARSLPEGYAAPCLSQILNLSGNLRFHPYRRLLGVMQMVIDVASPGGFDDDGRALVSAAKLRLQHSGIRLFIVPKHLPEYEERFGPPVNLEDMLGTVMGFSWLVIDGLRRIGLPMTDDEAGDFYYLWRIFSQAMGIHPPGEPDSSEFVPATLDDAAEFYAAYARRHYAPQAKANPDGTTLARENLQMLNDLLPQTPLRRLGFKFVPRVYMQRMMGRHGLRRVGIRPIWGFLVLRFVINDVVPRLYMRVWKVVDTIDSDHSFHERLSRVFFQHLIDETRGRVAFMIPMALEDLRQLDQKIPFGEFIQEHYVRAKESTRRDDVAPQGS